MENCMRRSPVILPLLLTTGLFAACGNADTEAPVADIDAVDVSTTAPAVSFTPEGDAAGKPGGPVTVEYRIIGQPVVGQPIAVELRFVSSIGDQPLKVAYRISDATALRLADSQPANLTVAPAADGSVQRVSVVPLREGRIFLNVSANVESRDGSVGTVTAIPIQVGNVPRPVQQNGTAGTDENGAAIRSLPATEE